MFEDSTFESTGRIRTRSRRWMLATFVLNGSVLVALILIPLIYPEALPGKLMTVLLSAPPPPAAQQPEPVATRAPQGDRRVANLDLSIPTRISNTIPKPSGADQAPGDSVMLTMNDPDGIPGGVRFPSTSPTPAQPAPRPAGPTHISLGVAAGLLIQKAIPIYPPIARAARVEGAVALQAIISKNGTIENLRVVSGHPMLQQAAIDAVKQWRYRPYMLDGDPVEVETTINVIFSLGH